MKIYYLYPVTTKPANHETLKLAPIRLVCIYRSKSYHSRQKYMALYPITLHFLSNILYFIENYNRMISEKLF